MMPPHVIFGRKGSVKKEGLGVAGGFKFSLSLSVRDKKKCCVVIIKACGYLYNFIIQKK